MSIILIPHFIASEYFRNTLFANYALSFLFLNPRFIEIRNFFSFFFFIKDLCSQVLRQQIKFHKTVKLTSVWQNRHLSLFTDRVRVH